MIIIIMLEFLILNNSNCSLQAFYPFLKKSTKTRANLGFKLTLPSLSSLSLGTFVHFLEIARWIHSLPLSAKFPIIVFITLYMDCRNSFPACLSAFSLIPFYSTPHTITKVTFQRHPFHFATPLRKLQPNPSV